MLTNLGLLLGMTILGPKLGPAMPHAADKLLTNEVQQAVLTGDVFQFRKILMQTLESRLDIDLQQNFSDSFLQDTLGSFGPYSSIMAAIGFYRLFENENAGPMTDLGGFCPNNGHRL